MFKKSLFILSVLFILPTVVNSASYTVSKNSCSYVENNISSIKASMREKGYTQAKGEYLRERLAELNKQRRECKMNNFPTSR